MNGDAEDAGDAVRELVEAVRRSARVLSDSVDEQLERRVTELINKSLAGRRRTKIVKRAPPR